MMTARLNAWGRTVRQGSFPFVFDVDGLGDDARISTPAFLVMSMMRTTTRRGGFRRPGDR